MNEDHTTLDKNGRMKWDNDIFANEYYEGKWIGNSSQKEISREETLNKLHQQKSSILSKKHGGLFCEVCNKSFMDSSSFTAHINTQEHMQKAGIHSSYKTVTLADIKTKLALLKEKKKEQQMSPEEKEQRRQEWKMSRKQRKKEWKERSIQQQKQQDNDDKHLTETQPKYSSTFN